MERRSPEVAPGATRQFEVKGLKRKHWSTATSIRKIFREAFEAVGLPYFNPHSFRHTLAQLGQKICLTPEKFKAWSQNLGHEGVMTTFNSYGEVSHARQGEIIQGLSAPRSDTPQNLEELAKAVIDQFKRRDEIPQK